MYRMVGDSVASIKKVERIISGTDRILKEKTLHVTGESLDEVKKVFDERWKE